VQCKEYAAHQETCEYRKVLCPGSPAECGKMVAFRDLKEHVQTCPGITNISPGNKSGCEVDLYDEELGQDIIGSTGVIKYNSEYSFLKQRKDIRDTYMAEVVMLGAKADGDKFTVEITVLDSTDTPAFRHLGHPRPVGQDAWGDVCLAVPRPELLGACVRDEQKKAYTVSVEVTIRSVSIRA
jgi:hypothetical protein